MPTGANMTPAVRNHGAKERDLEIKHRRFGKNNVFKELEFRKDWNIYWNSDWEKLGEMTEPQNE